jgi:hypothetical protein
VGTATEYENLIAEIHFPGKCGFIVSQERGEGDFDVSVHSFGADQQSHFDFNRNVERAKIPLADLLLALNTATSELIRLRR